LLLLGRGVEKGVVCGDALAAVAVSGAAFAQATISGGISVGVMNTGAAGEKARVQSLGGGANAINITTSEDLGGGLRAGFTSQIRFNAASGDMGSAKGAAPTATAATDTAALFHAANVFVGGSFGTVRVGKIAETSLCAFDPWGCTGGAGIQGGPSATIGGAGAGLVAALTQAESVSYATPSISGFSASYQTSASKRTNERNVLNINYSQGPLAASFVQASNAANAVNADNVIADTKSTQQAIGISYNLGVAKVDLINATIKSGSTTSSDITAVGVTVPMGAITILGGYAKDSKNATSGTKTALGVNYALSKRTTVGADIFQIKGNGNGYVARVRHNF
jgi:hypothetical protein